MPADPVTKIRIPEIYVPGKALGRNIEHDERSKDYAAPPEETGSEIHDVEWSSVGLPLDQKRVGKCTAEACLGCQNCEPNWDVHTSSTLYGEQRAPDTPFSDNDTDALYARETANEGMPWPQYDPGGSGLAVCKAALQMGMIGRYWHCFGLEHGLRGLMIRPIMFGLNWYNTMDDPDGDGIISVGPGAFIRGGHEIFCYKAVVSDQLLWFWNSWGTSYGLGGRMAMTFTTAERLLAEQGDITVPVPT